MVTLVSFAMACLSPSPKSISIGNTILKFGFLYHSICDLSPCKSVINTVRENRFMTQILAFGASDAVGYWDPRGGWVARLREVMDRKRMADPDFWCAVRNLGLSGQTTMDLLKRFESETRERLGEGDIPIVIFWIGGNDSAYVGKIGKPKVPEKQFEKNIKALIKQAKKFTKNIIFLELTRVDESKVYDKPWLGWENNTDTDYFYSNERVKLYSAITRKICSKEKVYFLRLPKELRGNSYKKFLFDGLHLNSRGHELIFRNVLRFLYAKKLMRLMTYYQQ
jgi:lysophospholipase L1-like esterase